jgi:cell pole-organizing protein PopZ
MSKPQMASEPSMEDILASIRKMISDDKPGPSPMPDVMGRTPFGESPRSSGAGGLGAGSPADTAGRGRAQSGPNFNSLADALKVATTLSDQRRALQQEIAEVLDKAPRNNLEALTELSAARNEATRSLLDDQAKKAGTSAATGQPAPVSSPAGADAKPDLLGFDFGTMVPLKEDAKSKPGEDKTGRAPSTGLGASEAGVKTDAKSDPTADSRVLPLRSGLSGAAALNVAPFPRAARETAKANDSDPAAEPAVGVTSETTPVKPTEAVAEQIVATPLEPSPSPMGALFKTDTLDKHSEALLDAVVDLVQQKPSALSVFASGDSFINGSGGKKPAAKLPVIAEATEVVDAPASGASAPKLDRAAAELLRPMLRQWLSENMERILEDALRSELSDKVSGKEPEKG